MKSPYAPSLTTEAFAALPLSERLCLVASYYTDVATVHEDAPHVNRGETLDAWARYLGYGVGLPWCGIAVTTFLRLAGYSGPIPSGPAGTHNWIHWAEANGYALPKGQVARRGDIWVLKLTPTTGHMGVAIGDKDGDGKVDTLEGNTNTDGSRDGYTMARHDRYLVANATTFVIRLRDVDVSPDARIPAVPAPLPIHAVVMGHTVDALLIADDAAPVAVVSARQIESTGIFRILDVAPGVLDVAFIGSLGVGTARFPLYVVDGRGYVPAKALAQAMKRSLVWNNQSKAVIVG